MSNVLRNPWVSATVHEKLAGALAEREGGSIQDDTIGPSGELQFPGDKCKLLQVVQFLSVEDPYTAVLSDKVVEITCKFSSEARSKHEASNGDIAAMEGGIIKVESYQICFFGVDGTSFWKGVTYQAQVAGGPIPGGKGKEAKKNSRNNNIGSSKSVARGREGRNTGVSFKDLPTPEPVLFITKFSFIGSEGSNIWGKPISISLKADIKQLLSDLPRKKYSNKEIQMRPEQARRTRSGIKTPHQENEGKGAKHQRDTYPPQGNSSRKNGPSKSSIPPRNVHDSDDEIRSQPDVDGDDISSQKVSQLPFATQVPPHFSATFDDLEFSTQAGPKKKIRTRSPPPSPLQNYSGSAGRVPQVVITTRSREKEKVSRPHQARKNAEQSKCLGVKQKFINYADGSDFEETTADSVVKGRAKDKPEVAGNRNKRKRGGLDDPAMSDSGSIGVRRNCKGLSAHRGWQGMKKITKEETIIPKDQQEILDRPESWYPYQDNHHVSGYDSVPKVQPVPKSYPPRDHPIHPRVQAVAPGVPTPSSPQSVSSSDDKEYPWSPSPVRSPVRDINAMPPDSSMPTGPQPQCAGRWSAHVNEQKNPGSTQVSSTEGSSYQPDQASMYREVIELEGKNLRIQSSPSDSDAIDKLNDTSKRVTRAANGISRKAPVDPNNVEPLRIARVNQKSKFPVARKRRRPESKPEEESSEDYESSEGGDIHGLINDPDLPVDVVNPNGRTRIAVFGGILKAQQVALWEKQRKREQESGGTGCETENGDCGAQSGDDGDTSDKQPESGEDNEVDGDALKATTREMMEPPTPNSPSMNQDKRALESLLGVKGTCSQSHNEGPVPEDDPMNAAEQGPPLRAIQSTCHLETVEPPLPFDPNQTPPQLEKEKILEPAPGSSPELPMIEQIDIDADGGDETPQVPFMPLDFVTGTKARVSSILKQHNLFLDLLKEVSTKPAERDDGSQTVTGGKVGGGSKSQQATAPGDSFSTAISLQTLSAPEVSNLSGSQGSAEDVLSPSLPSSASIAAPTVQVEETPYCKGLKLRRGESSSPTISKSRTGPGYLGDGFDDITLIPGTNTEELHNSPASVSLRVAQNLTAGRRDPPGGQAVPLNCASSSTKSENHEADFPDDSTMSRQQLRRELLEHMEVEVPATLEVGNTRIEGDIRSQPPPVRELPKSKPRKARNIIKVVDFESQEIRAAANANHVSSMLQEQKRQFMNSKDVYEFEDMFKQDTHTPTSGNLGQASEIKVFKKSSTSPKVIDIQSSPVSSVTSHLPIGPGGENLVSDRSQANIRKRPQSPPSEVFIPTKKQRANDESPSETGRHSASVPPPCPAMHEKVETLTKPQSKPSPIPTRIGSLEAEGLELGNDDLMAGFPAISSPTDDGFEPPWPAQTSSEPEMYAGIRERHLYIPSYRKLTDDQKKELDRRRKEYFGIETPSERLFSVELQRAMQKASSSSSSRRKVKSEQVGERLRRKEDEWYRDEDTPMKVFFRKFKQLKQVKAELAIRERGGERNGDSA